MDEQMNVGQGGSKSGMGALIGAVIVIIVLIAGGIYFYSQRAKTTPTQPSATQEVTDLQTQASSTENFDSLGAGIDKL